MSSLTKLNKRIINCKKCPRLSSYIREVGHKKVKRFSHERYWAKPLPGFGDINAQLVIIGLAPAAHGGNRTGRMFTGDSSGDWLAKVLHKNGFANKPESKNRDDGFVLKNAYITAAVRCAPPNNKPLREEFENCSNYLRIELNLLNKSKVIICLGKLSFDSLCRVLGIKGISFAHGLEFSFNNFQILCSYHPSRQNTQTGRLEWNQWNKIFQRAQKILEKPNSSLMSQRIET